MPLTLKQITDVCRDGDGADQCRYLAEDDQGKFYCIKHTAKRSPIDVEVADFKKKQKSHGQDPAALGIPLGDNCKGYTFFRYKTQGYDVP